MHGCSQGVCVVALGGVHGCSLGGWGHAWLLQGGVHGCSWGACMVAPGGHAWLLPGGHAWLLQGGGVWLLRGVCMVAPGGLCVVAPGGACVVAPGGGMRGFFDEIRSMSGRFASYWNAYLLEIFLQGWVQIRAKYNSDRPDKR